ncbi:MAG: SDR family oxidoreductase [Ilumatobacteraceae bacterium]
MFDLTDRLALVTGGSRGLGAATARLLAQQGADVVFTYRKDVDQAAATLAAIEATGRRGWTHQLDLADGEAIDALFETIAAEHGGLDIVVANAAQTKFAELIDVQPHHVDRTFAITVSGFLRLVQRAVPLLEARGGGRIVAVSGADTKTHIAAHGLLAAAKAGMEIMVSYLGVELGRRNITTIGVCPGFIAGDSMRLMVGDFFDATVEEEARTHPLGITATPDDVAAAVVLVCTDAARLLNGSTIMADGAGVFAYCSRATAYASEHLVASGQVSADTTAPSVVRFQS